MNRTVVDQSERLKALDISKSFIVQAPAGSGKTSLLTQRYLKLLTIVSSPEEALAITFTRKAAAEMRNRIVSALESAHGSRPGKEHEALTWELACAVLKRDAEQQWDLTRNPNRLRIQTIDALCSRLAGSMPLLTQLGGSTRITDDASLIYRQAARETLFDLEHEFSWSDAVGDLLIHLDNSFDRVESLLAEMLAKRDQWLRLISSIEDTDELRDILEENLRHLIEQALVRVTRSAPASVIEKLVEYGKYSAKTLEESNKRQQGWDSLLEIEHTPGATASDLRYWKSLAELVFVKNEARLRKQVIATQGFPASNKEQQLGFMELLKQLEGSTEEFLDGLHSVRNLPAPAYSDSQWQLLQGLLPLLKAATAHLQLIFGEQGVLDHTEISLRALSALGTDEEPTDLSLMLDHRISHILVDEFQDTSHTQYELLRRLTMGWEPGDGRTLFCVGDPMQSIYRFREADVGLYLLARSRGIGDIPLEPLTLSVNFRSNAKIIAWINDSFPAIFPLREDLQLGAITYSPSDAIHEEDADSRVVVHPIATKSGEEEANRVAEIISESLSSYPEENLAVLVRSRSHLARLLPVLRERDIPFRVTDAERLESLPMVQDLRSLARAMLHPADRLAWFSLLRAPWCGMTLDDLSQLTERRTDKPLWSLINSENACAALSEDGRQRVERIRQIMSGAFRRRGRQPLRQWIEGTWLALGGPALASGEQELLAAELVFGTIGSLEKAGGISELQQLEAQLAALFAPPDPEAGNKVEILTMHKAKGLEFDSVILPGLGRPPRGDNPELLQWLRYNDADSSERLLMATIREAGESSEPISDYLRRTESRKQTLESARLLYVATTRAKKRLHLVGHVRFNKEGEPYPDSRSLLAQLWPAVENDFAGFAEPEEEDRSEEINVDTSLLKRVTADWQPRLTTDSPWEACSEPAEVVEERPEFEWASETARSIGTLVHSYLEIIADEGVDFWNQERISTMEEEIHSNLRRLNVPEEEIKTSASKIELALVNAVTDEKAHWILSDHQDARCELDLTLREESGLRRIIIDRTFIDEAGQRWIIDYKSGSHEGGDLDAFLDSEEDRYRDQLLRYGNAMKQLGDQPVRLALYFPLLKAWREIPFDQ